MVKFLSTASFKTLGTQRKIKACSTMFYFIAQSKLYGVTICSFIRTNGNTIGFGEEISIFSYKVF